MPALPALADNPECIRSPDDNPGIRKQKSQRDLPLAFIFSVRSPDDNPGIRKHKNQRGLPLAFYIQRS
jgi:hypothetical protein